MYIGERSELFQQRLEKDANKGSVMLSAHFKGFNQLV
jgi:hypothetical protein